jgi:hypothetical protein
MELHRDRGLERVRALAPGSAALLQLRPPPRDLATTIVPELAGRIIPSDVPGKESRVCRKPVGVVAVMALGTARLWHLAGPWLRHSPKSLAWVTLLSGTRQIQADTP